MRLPAGGDSAFFLDLYSRYRRDPHSVPADWAVHFESLDGNGTEPARDDPAGLVWRLQEAYRRFGHLEAQLDPLSENSHRDPVLTRLRDAAARSADTRVTLVFGGEERGLTLAQAERALRAVYAGTAAVEVDHLHDGSERHWWYAAAEAAFSSQADEAMQFAALESVALVDEFETFMHKKFAGKKRFGGEGAETAIVLLRELWRLAPANDVRSVVMGGMHRGRLATLAVGFGKNPATLAAELTGRDLSDGAAFTGDVPYHLGFSGEADVEGHRLSLSILPHPSHLLVVAPVALGLARARSRAAGEAPGSTLCVLAHTDAAFSGQGLSAELLQIGGLQGYTAGGTIHLVFNNQIGFTTLPSEGRSAHYCTDVCKAAGVPVIHVNGDDPAAVARAAGLAMSWRSRFRRDVVVDLVCYRRNGHNELDEPRFTQPEMWKLIDRHPSVRSSFSRTVAEKAPHLLTLVDAVAQAFRDRLQTGFDLAGDVAPNEEPVQGETWAALSSAADEDDLLQTVTTGVETSRLRRIGLAASRVAEGVAPHPKVRKFYEAREDAIRNGEGINFATAEALALATLLSDGAKVRMSGQDSVRGTFTQRHHRVHDIHSGKTCMPLQAVAPVAGSLELINSPLSEYGVLGFEYGHSLYDPEQLTIWEAQFGDFLNGAQVVVDQYIVSAEAKWRLRSGLVVLLPHGLEGQGPDHSSARIERLAQLCAGGNLILAQPSTPANLFHLLRRQIEAPWRKPLFVLSPKSLLRSRDAVSTLADMGETTAFRPILAERCDAPERVRRVVLCSGKIYYELERARRSSASADAVVPVRIEQIYPFPHAALKQALAPFGNAEIVWLQEEAENQGAWRFVRDELSRHKVNLSRTLPVVARPALPVCAGGSIDRHQREQGELLERILGDRA